jgi:hypothetical protein
VTGTAEAFDLADLGDHEHRRVGADPAQLAEHVDARVVAGKRVDLSLRQLDLAVEVTDQAEQTVESPPRRLAEGKLAQERASARAEEVGMLALDPPDGQAGRARGS